MECLNFIYLYALVVVTIHKRAPTECKRAARLS